MEHIVCIVSDGILNMGTCLVLPLIVFLPYVHAFDPEDYVFPMEILYGDIEFTNFVMENQCVLTTSFVDGLAKIVSHCAIFTGFPAIQSLVRRAIPSFTSPTPSDTNKSTVRIRSVSSSFQAELFCLQIMRPWFASRQPCAIYRVDCKHIGEDSPAPEVLNRLDELVLLNIYFMNCPQLEVPTSIQRFPNLIGVEVHNSTIAQWSVDAAIRAHLHPRMMYLIMVRVNMTGLPDGVLQPLPPLLTDIELIHTNLTALPDDLDERWPNMALLFFEYGQIHEFPPVLLKMPIYELSLIGNRIEELPSLKAEYNVLSMANNLVTKLPETIDANAYVAFFSLHGAKVETLPRWVATHVKECCI